MERLDFKSKKSGFELNLSNPSSEWVQWIRNPFLEQKIHFGIEIRIWILDKGTHPVVVHISFLFGVFLRCCSFVSIVACLKCTRPHDTVRVT